MKLTHLLAASAVLGLAAVPAAQAQVAGGTVLGIERSVVADVAKGWSVKKSIMGKEVHNDAAKPEEVGTIDDIILAPDGTASYVILNASKFLGLSSHLVAIPIKQLRIAGDKVTLPGSTKDKLRDVPVFQYSAK